MRPRTGRRILPRASRQSTERDLLQELSDRRRLEEITGYAVGGITEEPSYAGDPWEDEVGEEGEEDDEEDGDYWDEYRDPLLARLCYPGRWAPSNLSDELLGALAYLRQREIQHQAVLQGDNTFVFVPADKAQGIAQDLASGGRAPASLEVASSVLPGIISALGGTANDIGIQIIDVPTSDFDKRGDTIQSLGPEDLWELVEEQPDTSSEASSEVM